MSGDFTPDQKRYLEGFAFGAMAVTGRAAGAPAPAAAPAPTGPDAEHVIAQDAVLAAGRKLVDQEKWKRAEHPFDAYGRFKEQAAKGEYPKPEDNFRWRYHGLFYVAPAQNSYMCRLRIPNGILTHWQLAGVADLADRLGGGFSHVTTRANLQVREIAAENGPGFIEGLIDLGLGSRGSGADNIRNVTGGSTAGIDPQELLDTRPFARAWHHHVLNERGLYGLPRKFNVAFDGGGRVATLEDTNDVGFQAVEVLEGAAVPAGVYFRLVLGGITGHRDLARDTGVVLPPEDATAVADAIIRVFSATGDRTNRAKSRMKYVLDAIGFDAYLAKVEAHLGRPLARADGAHVAPRPAQDRQAHVGVHPQKQPGLNWLGVALPVGKLTTDQMRALAAVSRDLGDGDVRLTVWQNLLLSGVPDAAVGEAVARIDAAGLGTRATSLRAGLVACTGATGCKFAASHTKEDAALIADHVDARLAEQGLALDVPVNVHLTGCHHSCAQHYIGDLGLIGAKVAVGDEGDTVEGYDVLVGGGAGTEGAIARDLVKAVKAEDAPALVERLLAGYLARRASPAEGFQAFTHRTPIEELRALVGAPAEEAA